MQIQELDWKLLRQLQPLALERHCERSLREIVELAGNADASWHERYLDVLRSVGEMREEMAHAFDDLRRSNALIKLSLMRERGLLTDEEFAGFSDETRQSIERLIAV